MKPAEVAAAGPEAGSAAIVQLASVAPAEPAGIDPVARARAFAEPLLAGQALDTGEDAFAHADGVATVLRQIGAAPSLEAAAYLVYAGDYLQRPEEVVRKAFGASHASLVMLTRQLVEVQRAARAAQSALPGSARRPRRADRARAQDVAGLLA